ncbi:MAG: hypothetical protein ACXAC5_01885 [Promethearchaeota archaeon]|jgi:hypothetical protein
MNSDLPRLTECGTTPDGRKVRAITDVVGPQVVVTWREETKLSQPLEDHAAAEVLGRRVAREGIQCYSDWQDPIGSLEELAIVLSIGCMLSR